MAGQRKAEFGYFASEKEEAKLSASEVPGEVVMPCAKPNDLRLVFVKLQAITGHPIANAFEAAGEAFNCFLARGHWYTDIQLCIS